MPAKKQQTTKRSSTAKKKTTTSKSSPKKSSSKSSKDAAKKVAPATIAQSRIEQHYTKIVAGFVLVTLLLIGSIVYFSLSKTTITVVPNTLEQEVEITSSLEELGGVLLIAETEGEKEFSGSSNVSEQPGLAGGTVTIVNSYSQAQPLVATTRLLSDEGVLFRTQETVTVPAGGSVEVAVAADEEGAQGNIGPSRFEIVALWDGLKDQIYATSDAPMTGGVVYRATLTDKDIQAANSELQEELLDGLKETFDADIAGRNDLPQNAFVGETVYIDEILSSDVSAEAGDEVDSFTVYQELRGLLPIIDEDALDMVIEQNVQEVVPSEVTLLALPTVDDAEIAITNINDNGDNATVTIIVNITTTINENSALLDARELINLSATEVQSYFSSFDEVKSVSVLFSPFWVTRTPGMAESINIQLQQ